MVLQKDVNLCKIARLHRTLSLQLKRLHRYDGMNTSCVLNVKYIFFNSYIHSEYINLFSHLGTKHNSKLAQQRRLLSIKYRRLMKSHLVATVTANSSSRYLPAIVGSIENPTGNNNE